MSKVFVVRNKNTGVYLSRTKKSWIKGLVEDPKSDQPRIFYRASDARQAINNCQNQKDNYEVIEIKLELPSPPRNTKLQNLLKFVEEKEDLDSCIALAWHNNQGCCPIATFLKETNEAEFTNRVLKVGPSEAFDRVAEYFEVDRQTIVNFTKSWDQYGASFDFRRDHLVKEIKACIK